MNFTWGMDERGMHGWIADGYPNFDVTQPGTFSHDCLEHLPRGLKHGAIADELMALGARLFVRVKSEWWWTQRFNADPPESWGRELQILLQAIHWGEQHAPPSITEPLLDDDMDDEIDDALENGARIANREHEYMASHDQEAGEREPYTAESEPLQNMAAWLRRGYRAAVARFKGSNPADIMWLGECLDKEMRDYENGEHGDRLRIHIHEKDMEFKIAHRPIATSAQIW
jgi:hypothetical protein